MATSRKGFSGIQTAAKQSMAPPAAAAPVAAPAPSAPAPAVPAAAPAGMAPAPWMGGSSEDRDNADQTEQHPIYDAQAGEDPDAGHAHLMHDLGTAIQEMMTKDPQTNKSMSDMMEEFMGKGIDYDSESKRLRGLVDARQTAKRPNWVAQGVGTWAGGSQVGSQFQKLQDTATSQEQQKESDKEDIEKTLLGEHVADLRARGKTREALMMGLMQGVMGQKKEETKQEGAMERAEFNAQTRKELQDRSLGAAEERVRLNISSRHDIADKDRTAGQVMHLYESLLKQSEKDVTGAQKPVYQPDEAMQIALRSILPQVKAGVTAVKTGKTPATDTTTPAAVKPSGGTSKFAQWKAQQAAATGPAKK